jgi:hypothetical protein
LLVRGALVTTWRPGQPRISNPSLFARWKSEQARPAAFGEAGEAASAMEAIQPASDPIAKVCVSVSCLSCRCSVFAAFILLLLHSIWTRCARHFVPTWYHVRGFFFSFSERELNLNFNCEEILEELFWILFLMFWCLNQII